MFLSKGILDSDFFPFNDSLVVGKMFYKNKYHADCKYRGIDKVVISDSHIYREGDYHCKRREYDIIGCKSDSRDDNCSHYKNNGKMCPIIAAELTM